MLDYVQYLQSTYYVPDSVLGAEGTVIKMGKGLVLMRLKF